MTNKGIRFDEIHSYHDLNLILSGSSIPPALPKTNYIEIVGGDGDLDLTEALGEVKFNSRECEFVFTMNPSGGLTDADFEAKKTEVSNLLNGRVCRITLDKDAAFYYVGRTTVSEFKSDRRLRQIVVTAKVQPYKYKQEETVVSVDLTATEQEVTLTNGRKSVVPVITANPAEAEVKSGREILFDSLPKSARFSQLLVNGDSWQNQYEGYQMFDISKLTLTEPSDVVFDGCISELGDNYIVVTTTDKHNGNGYCNTNKTLREVCPNLVVGETYLLNANTESTDTWFYIGTVWEFGKTVTITEDMLSSNLVVYGYNARDYKQYGSCKISDITIVKGTVGKEWEKYFGGQPSPSMECQQPIVSSGQILYGGNQLFDAESLLNNTYGVSENNGEYYFQEVSVVSAWVSGNFVPFEVEDGMQYTLSADLKCESTTDFGLAFVYSDGSTSNTERQTNSEWYHVKATSELGKTVVAIGTVYGSTGSGYMRDIMVCKGTEALPYEPYTGGVPKPVDVGVEVKVLGGNLVNQEKAEFYVGQSAWIDDSVVICHSINSLGRIVEIPFKGEKGKTYHYSYRIKKNASNVSVRIYFDETQQYFGTVAYETGTIKGTVTLNGDVTRVSLYSSVTEWGEGVDIQIDDIIFSEIDIPFEPYKEPQTLTIPYAMRKGDKVDYASGERLQGSKIKIFDGTEDWYQYSDVVALANWDDLETPQHSNNDKIGLLSNVAIEGTQGFGNVDGQFTSYNLDGTDWIVFNFGISVEYWKTYLAEQYAKGTPVYVQYPIAEPIITDLTEAEIQAYKALIPNIPTTKIISEAELEVGVEASVVIEHNGNSYVLSEGKHKILDLQLKQGETELKVSGSGTVEFRYQEGDL